MRAYGLIGYPVDHSLSPHMHNAAFNALGMDCSYAAYNVTSEGLAEGVAMLKEKDFSGFNVTMPLKQSILSYLDSTDESCEMVGAVNTVDVRGGRWRGYNTDMDGFLQPLRDRGVDMRGARVLVFGAGGGARAATAGLAKEGVRYIRVCNRSRERGQNLVSYLAGMGVDAEYSPIPPSVGGGFDIVANLSAVGMYGGLFPVDLSEMPADTVAYDIVYHPMRTDFLTRAGNAGARIVHGWEMLLGQGALSFKVWRGVDGPVEVMKQAILEHI